MADRLRATEHEFIIALCKSHLKNVIEVESTLFTRFTDMGLPANAELAEMFEEIANIYMDMSEAITSAIVEAHHEVHAWPQQKGSPEQPSG